MRCCLLLLVVFVSVPSVSAQPAERPNILLILTDDQGWGDLYSHGNAEIDTPHLDRLGAEGTRFERFYVSPVCAPTRAALLTGRYPLRTGSHGVTRAHETMRAHETTLGEVLQANGYDTALFGKWHNGSHFPHNPNGQGFAEFFGFSMGHWNNYFDTDLEHNGTMVPTEGYVTDVLTDAAVDYMRQEREAPFFAYVSYNTPHSPFQLPDRYFEKYKRRGFDDKNASVYGMVEHIDDNVGRLLETLETTGQRENTLVMFLTDNGPNGQRYNGGMKGTKGSVNEGGTRVPMLMQWPGSLPPGQVVRPITAHIDVLPTLVDWLGLANPGAKPLDGVSWAPLLRGEATTLPDRMIFNHHVTMGEPQPTPASVRTERWLAVNTRGDWELYDMLIDPMQQSDVAALYPAVTTELSKAWAAWFADVTSEGFAPIPAELGHASHPTLRLPGHEAIVHRTGDDGLWYHKGQGWSNDWLDNWTDADAYATWPIRIVTSGAYRVQIEYAVPEAHIGATLSVTVAGTTVQGTLVEAHDPEYRHSPDRVYRGEVYEKTWATLDLGTLTLPAGTTDVTLRATSIPNGEVGQIKTVILTRVDE
ncbi:MAG: sulfatase-like hydrolase/transferase [Bacteroidota bacterium]